MRISESKKGIKNPMYGKCGNLNKNSISVIATDKNGNEITFQSISMAAKELGLSDNAFKNISACCKNKRPTAYGYKWCCA